MSGLLYVFLHHQNVLSMIEVKVIKIYCHWGSIWAMDVGAAMREFYMCEFTYENLHIRVCIWEFTYENLDMRVYIWEFSNENLHIRVCMWEFTCENLHMKVYILKFTC